MKRLTDAGAAYLWSIVIVNLVSAGLVLYMLYVGLGLIRSLASSSFAL